MVSHYPYERETVDYFSGGTGAVAQGLSHALTRMGHMVDVVCVSADGRRSHEQHGYLTIRRSGALFRVAQANISASIFWESMRQRYDLVHVHAGNPPAPLAGMLYALRFGVPLVVTYHGDPIANHGSPPRRAGVAAWALALRLLLRAADRVTCPSEPFVAYSRLLRRYQSRVEVVPNGIDPADFAFAESRAEAKARLGIPADAPVVLFLGALSPYKAPDLLIRAVARLAATQPAARFVIAGAGSLESELHRLAKTLGLHDRITFLGFVGGETRLRAFRGADLFVLPSTLSGEVFPMALVEASAFGLPLVVSDLPTFGSIVTHDWNGLVTRRGDSVDLARALSALLGDESRRERLGSAARERIAEFAWPNVAARYEAIYRDCLEQRVQARQRKERFRVRLHRGHGRLGQDDLGPRRG